MINIIEDLISVVIFGSYAKNKAKNGSDEDAKKALDSAEFVFNKIKGIRKLCLQI